MSYRPIIKFAPHCYLTNAACSESNTKEFDLFYIVKLPCNYKIIKIKKNTGITYTDENGKYYQQNCPPDSNHMLLYNIEIEEQSGNNEENYFDFDHIHVQVIYENGNLITTGVSVTIKNPDNILYRTTLMFKEVCEIKEIPVELNENTKPLVHHAPYVHQTEHTKTKKFEPSLIIPRLYLKGTGGFCIHNGKRCKQVVIFSENQRSEGLEFATNYASNRVDYNDPEDEIDNGFYVESYLPGKTSFTNPTNNDPKRTTTVRSRVISSGPFLPICQ